jgi:chromatin assembly factor 1 subunit B
LKKSFCTHIFGRENRSTPYISLVGLEDPAVAIRCSPRLYKLVKSEENQQEPWSKKPYRMIFAVVTIHNVMIYDTQHTYPIAKLSGQHYAPINDAAWSGDGNKLVFCSSDGYVTIVRFYPGALGE